MMPKVMEPELFDAGIGYEFAPSLLDVGHVEDLPRTALARLPMPTLQNFHGFDV